MPTSFKDESVPSENDILLVANGLDDLAKLIGDAPMVRKSLQVAKFRILNYTNLVRANSTQVEVIREQQLTIQNMAGVLHGLNNTMELMKKMVSNNKH
jgi:hypothetical protein